MAVQTTHRTAIPANQVVALLADKAPSFSLASGATFADLAARLEYLGTWQHDLPQAISLKLGTVRKPFTVAKSAI
jgi:hypothetical protein